MRGRRLAAAAALLVAGSVLAAPTSASSAGTSSAPAAGAVARHRYAPPKGPTFNDPLGNRQAKYRALNVVQNAMNHARSGSTIRIMSWNIMSRSVVDNLLNAQRRHVRVLAIMDSSNATLIPNPSWHRLRRGLIVGNRQMKLAPPRQSHAKLCDRSCRGTAGQAHAKYFLFSHTGVDRKVLMEGSSNLTAAAATNQWNDVFVTGKPGLYNFAHHVFDQAWHDHPYANPYARLTIKSTSLIFAPLIGTDYHGDPRLHLLDHVRCFQARHSGLNGRTVIRSAPDVLRNKTGLAFAQQLRYLWNRGCNVKVGYTVLGVDIHKVLRNAGAPRGPVPLKHLAQDFNGDGQFDNYFHLKALTINGHLGSDHSAYVAVNGSSNVSGMAVRSDENIGIFHNRAITLQYQRYIDYWFTHFPKSKPLTTTAQSKLARGVLNPYAHVDMD